MPRKKRIRVSHEELNQLKQYRDSEYDESIPLGFVISELVPDE